MSAISPPAALEPRDPPLATVEGPAPAAGLRFSGPSEPDLVVARFRLLALRRSAWLDHLWQQEDGGSPGGAVSYAEIATILNDKDSPEAEALWLDGYEPAQGWAAQLAEVDQALTDLEHSRFARLAKIFDLNAVEQVNSRHFGLITMRERAKNLNGRLTIQTQPGKGTCVTLVIPLQAALAEK